MNTQSATTTDNLQRAFDYLHSQMESTHPRDVAEKLAALKVSDSVLYFIVLGLMYNVAVYQVGEVYADTAPLEEHELFFASTLAHEFVGAAVKIPLAATLEESFKIACEALGLEDLFRRECEAGHSLPRVAPQMDTAAA